MTAGPLEVALAEGEAVAAVLRTVSGAGWSARTDCPEWTVRDMAAHLVAQAEGAINPLVMLRRMRTGARRFPGRTGLDAYTAIQVSEHAGEQGPELTADFARLWPRAVRAMGRTPKLVRQMRADSGVPGQGKISVGYFYDSILPRDLWMHRIDLCRAVGAPLIHGDHDAAIVADVMRDVVAAWTGPSITLALTGPAGGTWSLGHDRSVASVTADAVDFMRMLAGRNATPELSLQDGDGSVLASLSAARVLF